MKTKIIIIIAIIIGVIASGTLSYFAYQMNQCESLPGYWHYPRPGIWNCLKFIDDYEKQIKSSENNQVEQSITLEVFSREMGEGGVTWTIQGKVDPVILDTSVTLLILKDGDLVEVKQLAVIVDDGLYKTSVMPQGPIWSEPGEYVVRITYGDEFVEDILKHEPKTVESVWRGEEEIWLTDIPGFQYIIHGANLIGVSSDSNDYLNIKVDAYNNGNLRIEFPNESVGDGDWNDYVIVIDGLEVEFDEMSSNEEKTTVRIPLPKGSELIQIIGMYPLTG